MRFRLRTLLILLTLGPPVVACVYCFVDLYLMQLPIILEFISLDIEAY